MPFDPDRPDRPDDDRYASLYEVLAHLVTAADHIHSADEEAQSDAAAPDWCMNMLEEAADLVLRVRDHLQAELDQLD